MSWNFLCADMFPYEDSKTVSVRLSICLYPGKRNYPGFVNISPTLVIDTSMERSSQVLQYWNPKIKKKNQKSLKFEFRLVTKSWNHLSFVNISPILVIDTSMERSSRVLQHAHGKCEFYKIKVAKVRKISSVKRHFQVIYRGSVAW